MKTTFTFLLFTLLLLGIHPGWCQEGSFLTGAITDEKGVAVGFATVAVVQEAPPTIITGTVAEENGRFQVKAPVAGTYHLRISSLGYVTQETSAFAVSGASFSKDFGRIKLQADAKQLGEVSVVALRPTIVQEADRMVVSVAGTAMAAGNTAFAVLAKSPGVFIDQEGNIQLNGKAGVTVMLDGKLTYLSARDLRNMLESMPAENLKNIEIMTNPPAKYDAEGTAGILNINLKKNMQQGLSGSVYTTGNYNFFRQFGYTYGGSLNLKRGKWNSFLNLNTARRVGGRNATFTRVFYGTTKTTFFDQTATGDFTLHTLPGLRLGSDYSLNKTHSVGFVAGYTKQQTVSDFLTDTYIGASRERPEQFVDADNISRNRYASYTGNLHYNGKLDTLGTTLTADLDYVQIRDLGQGDFYNYFTDLPTQRQTQDFLYTDTRSKLAIYSAKADYTHVFAKGNKLEGGVKFSRVTADNDSRFFFQNGALILDPLRTNHFNYQEDIQAAYVSWNGKASERLTLQTGLRLENTRSIGESYTTGQVTPRQYLNLFPSVFVQQKVSENYGINYSYSRRLNRPNYGSLNPFRFYRDPYTWVEGNPFLRPQYTHAVQVAHSYKKVYNLSLSYDYQTDVSTEIPILNVEETTTTYTTGNLDNGHMAGLTAVAPYQIVKWWDTQNTAVLSYRKFSTNGNNGPLTNEQLYYMLQSNHTIALPAKVRLEVELRYLGPTASGLYQIAPMHWVGLALKKSIFKEQLDVGVNINDLFKGYRYRFSTNINGNVNEFDQYFRFRSVGVSLRYHFSRGEKLDTKRRNNSLEELNRAN